MVNASTIDIEVQVIPVLTRILPELKSIGVRSEPIPPCCERSAKPLGRLHVRFSLLSPFEIKDSRNPMILLDGSIHVVVEIFIIIV